MKKHYVSLETAKMLKEKGYKQVYTRESEWYSEPPYVNPDGTEILYPKLQLHQAHQWLRDEHNIECIVGVDVDFTWKDGDEDLIGESIAKVKHYTYDICICNRFLMDNTIDSGDKEYSTYEQALEEGIINALKMI